jgi:multiple sugar transport system permease protein
MPRRPDAAANSAPGSPPDAAPSRAPAEPSEAAGTASAATPGGAPAATSGTAPDSAADPSPDTASGAMPGQAAASVADPTSSPAADAAIGSVAGPESGQALGTVGAESRSAFASAPDAASSRADASVAAPDRAPDRAPSAGSGAVVEAKPGRVSGPAGTASRVGSGALSRALTGWGFALPFALLFILFTAGPVAASLFMSVTDLRSADLLHPFDVNVVGLDNYVRLFSDEKFLTAAGNTAVFVVVGVPLTMALALVVALGLNSGLVRFQALFRVGYYLPVVTSIVAISVVWRFVLQPDTGLLNEFLGLFGIDGPNWLNNQTFALPTLIVMGAWRNLGFGMVIFLAGLQAIPKDLYEAATIDGARRFAQFRYLTVPMLRPTMLFVAVITTIGYVQFFEEPFVMTQGGPLDSTLSMAYATYNQFGFGNYGYASAMGYVLFVVVVLLSIAWFKLLRNNVD